MINFINSLFRIHLKRYQSEFDWHYNMPLRLQADLLKELLEMGANTAFGRRYKFSTIEDQASFAGRVPVHTYDELFPYIERSLEGEEGVLSESKIRWIAKTAGTTSGKSKFIPLTKENIYDCHVKGSWMSLAAMYFQREDLKIFAKKNLLIGGGVYGPYKNTDILMADISAVMVQHIPLVARPFYIPDVQTATMPDYEKKIELIAPLGAAETSITMLGGVPTWNLTLYRKILEMKGANHLLEVWPNLQAYIHGGVSFDPYRESFRKLIPSDEFIYHEVYNASEGYFALQDRLDDHGLLLLLNNGVYYEFVPYEVYRSGERHTVTLADVKEGETYVMVITTNTGLYRYILGDLVSFTSINPFRVKIVGRTQEFINAFGEDLLLDNAETALVKACQEFDCTVEDYTIAPRYVDIGQKGCHQWFVEFAKEPANLAAFSHALDVYLQGENHGYQQKRSNSVAIEQLDLISLPKGFFQDWLRTKGKIGGQNKVPRLANNRKFADEILALLAESA